MNLRPARPAALSRRDLLGALAVVLPIIGMMHLFMAEPLFAELFSFPMVMAPALVVPTLVMLNMLVVWRLFERLRERDSLAQMR